MTATAQHFRELLRSREKTARAHTSRSDCSCGGDSSGSQANQKFRNRIGSAWDLVGKLVGGPGVKPGFPPPRRAKNSALGTSCSFGRYRASRPPAHPIARDFPVWHRAGGEDVSIVVLSHAIRCNGEPACCGARRCPARCNCQSCR
jgi:hypothetical protein